MAIQRGLKTVIGDCYEKFTGTEKRIADYFLGNPSDTDFSSGTVAKLLYVSEASLSRFAQKLGYHGYREFIYEYTKTVEEDARLDQLTQESIQRYEMAVEKTREIVDNEQMIRIARCLDEKKRVFVYGVGSSSLVAREFEYRYVRLGLDVEALCDHNEISQNLTRVNSSCLVIGISLSGATTEVIDGLKNAHDKGAMTVLMTMVKTMKLDYADEIVHLAHVKNLTVSHIISPQIPALIMVDVLYTHYINYDKDKKMGRLQETLDNIAFKMEK